MTGINSQHYKEHVEIMKNLKVSEDYTNVREPYKEDFEKIYSKAQEEGVGISNAKEFLNSLSSDELSTIQNFALLVDEINVDSLSDEGAYNLLLHHYEKYDFNGDGYRENGISKGMGLIPDGLPSDAKKALVETFNNMDSKEMLIASAIFLRAPNMGNGQFAPNNEPFTFQEMQRRIENILDPKNKAYSSAEFRSLIADFWESFNDNYEKIKEEKAYYGIN